MMPDSELPGNPGPTLQAYKALMEKCWSPDAGARPNFKELVAEFQVGGEGEGSGERRGKGT
jgi:hypothetical protein